MPSQPLWIETNYVGGLGGGVFFLFFFMSHIKSCPAGAKSVSPSCHLYNKGIKVDDAEGC